MYLYKGMVCGGEQDAAGMGLRRSIQYGVVKNNNVISSVLRMMTFVHVPNILENRTWPEAIQKVILILQLFSHRLRSIVHISFSMAR